MNKAIFKYNNGIGAMLCNGCSVILKTGPEYSELERAGSMGEKHVDPQFCLPCNIKRIYNDNKNSIVDGYLPKLILLKYLKEYQIHNALFSKYIEINHLKYSEELEFKILI